MGMIGEGKPFNGDTFLEKEVLKLKEQFGIKSVIETGTYHGDTTIFFAENFSEVYTCELIEDNYKQALTRLNYYKNVSANLGGSETVLAPMIEAATKPVLIFLDAHWYKNPLLGELDIIAKAGIKPVLLIHDFKTDNPEHGFDYYPEQGITYDLPYVRQSLLNIYGTEYKRYYNTEAIGAKRGCLFVTPT